LARVLPARDSPGCGRHSVADSGRRVGRASSLATLVVRFPMTVPTVVNPPSRRAGTGTRDPRSDVSLLGAPPNAKNRVWEPTLALQKPRGSPPYSGHTPLAHVAALRGGATPHRPGPAEIGFVLHPGLFVETQNVASLQMPGRARYKPDRPNWLCFRRRIARTFSRNLFPDRQLASVAPFGNWLCFA
jgi:hypothetical protein